MSKQRSEGHLGPGTRHTPGPWTRDVRKGQTVVRSFYTGNGVAIVNGHEGEPLANARLIAAAPDLLAACEAAVTEYDLAKRAGFEPRMLVCLERTATLARAAIAKATT